MDALEADHRVRTEYVYLLSLFCDIMEDVDYYSAAQQIVCGTFTVAS
jgi:hypothetical protein